MDIRLIIKRIGLMIRKILHIIIKKKSLKKGYVQNVAVGTFQLNQ